MAIKGYFFNAVESGGTYDRVYNAEDVTSYLDLIVGSGVFPNPSTNLQVRASTGMNVIVGAGQGWISGHKMINTADLTLALDGSDVLLNRIDRIVFYVDYLAREMGIGVVKGEPASTATAPALTRTASRYEMCLAEVYIAKQAESVTASVITDTRGDATVCGYVQGLIQQMDTTTMFAQWQAAFDDWFETVQETLTNATLLRRYDGTYTTVAENEASFNVLTYVPEYNYALDMLTVIINGLTVSKTEYTQSGATITLNVPISQIGTQISFLVIKAVDTEDAQSVVEEVEELQAAVGALENGVYIATGSGDNQTLSNTVKSFLSAATDGQQMTVEVMGSLGITTPAAVVEGVSYWFDFASNIESDRRVIVDFSRADRVRVNNSGLLINGDERVEVVGLSGEIAGAGVSCANRGTFTRCKLVANGGSGEAHGVKGDGGLLRLTGCDVYGYNDSGAAADADAVNIPASVGGSLVMIGCHCPAAPTGSQQTASVDIESGSFALVANVLASAATLYETGSGKSETGTIVE